MNIILPAESRSGRVRVPASKSQAHRLLILAALGSEETTILCDGISKDIEATAACLNALGADIRTVGEGALRIRPLTAVREGVCDLPCGESGSTLRFLLPLVGALGGEAVFHRCGRLPGRPLAPLDRELTAHGMTLREEGERLIVSGQLTAGEYTLPGDVSSQYISALLMALPYLPGQSTLRVTGSVESSGYIAMTEEALHLAGISFVREGSCWMIAGGQRPKLPPQCAVEGDYSSAAFFLCMGALSREGICVEGVSATSLQGDRAVIEVLRRFGAEVEERADGIFVRRGHLRGIEIDAAEIPDLIPALAAMAATAEGQTRVVNAARLRLKESDRIRTTCALLRALGGSVQEQEAGLCITGVPRLRGGTVEPAGDHRIAMAAAVAACASEQSVVVRQSECVAKSYPRFWADLCKLKGERI